MRASCWYSDWSIESQSLLDALFCLVRDYNLCAFPFGPSCMSFLCGYTIVQMMDCLHILRNMTVSKVLFECYQFTTVLLECLILVDTLQLEANLFKTLYPVLWMIAICFHSLLDFIVCCSHVATPFSQWWIVHVLVGNIAMSKLIFEL